MCAGRERKEGCMRNEHRGQKVGGEKDKRGFQSTEELHARMRCEQKGGEARKWAWGLERGKKEKSGDKKEEG
jgi:hypothetical protein